MDFAFLIKYAYKWDFKGGLINIWLYSLDFTEFYLNLGTVQQPELKNLLHLFLNTEVHISWWNDLSNNHGQNP